MKTLTYSKNIFLPVTDLCRNHCGYCSFRKEPKDAHLISRSRALLLLEQGAQAGCSEALFTMGESPWSVLGFDSILAVAGVADLLDYLVELCELALELGLLPHTNAGLLVQEDLQRLQPYNASMGLMLETTALLEVHAKSPGKRPDLRLQYMAMAGRLKIPFTTGILVGIGESRRDRVEALTKIANLHRAFGHIQEVIIQPLDPKPGTALEKAPLPGMMDLCWTVEAAREIVPPDVAIQVPPNLVDPRPLVAAGATDLGGISSVTLDGINPDRAWPDEEDLHRSLSDYNLRERLPVYPRFIDLGWHGRKTRSLVNSLAGEDGLRVKKYIF
ncbi:MAG: 7,8-didemethyl-8-hydroxy-5-deazariboflavin synthase subunit CofG [Methanotrichaceae archaeon]|nr:7,8-didemethyl-8-hydroxy-5-deazariboflavin synthase subunit CofG [Methanotrichaceae archaeon]